MKPKISTHFPFDYEAILSKAKYAFLYNRSGNQGSDTRPMIIISEDEKLNKCEGYSIGIYNNGIEIHSEFSMPKDWVDVKTLSTDINGLLCEWLIQKGEKELIDN